MENAITIKVTTLQVLLSLVFQLWMLIFPILLIRKLNYLTAIIQEHLGANEKEAA